MVKPLCEETLLKIADKPVIVLEENAKIGGFGSMVCSFYLDKGLNTKVKCLGIGDQFVEHGSVKTQLERNGLQKQAIIKQMTKLFN